MEQKGPAKTLDRSSTRMPFSGGSDGFNDINEKKGFEEKKVFVKQRLLFFFIV
jgi:hypothetical protein